MFSQMAFKLETRPCFDCGRLRRQRLAFSSVATTTHSSWSSTRSVTAQDVNPWANIKIALVINERICNCVLPRNGSAGGKSRLPLESACISNQAVPRPLSRADAHKEARDAPEPEHPPGPRPAVFLLARRQRVHHERAIRRHDSVDAEIDQVYRPYRYGDGEPIAAPEPPGDGPRPPELEDRNGADGTPGEHEGAAAAPSGCGAVCEDADERLDDQARERAGHEDEGHE